MTRSIALSNLPLPSDCIHVIQSYAFIDKDKYSNILIKKSVNALLRGAVSAYTDYLAGIDRQEDVYLFRWYFDHLQHQIIFCMKCGDYIYLILGELNRCCECKCSDVIYI